MPAQVTADLQYSVGPFNPVIRSEWDALREHDVVFLLSVRGPPPGATLEQLQAMPFCERFGITSVRGGEVSE